MQKSLLHVGKGQDVRDIGRRKNRSLRKHLDGTQASRVSGGARRSVRVGAHEDEDVGEKE